MESTLITYQEGREFILSLIPPEERALQAQIKKDRLNKLKKDWVANIGIEMNEEMDFIIFEDDFLIGESYKD